MRLNKTQQLVLLRFYRGNPDGAKSYLEFRRRVFPLFGEPEVAMIIICGMYVGIEADGYAHS
jgi:hypothetical protein